MKTSFKDKSVLITGAASGLGKIMCRKALELGARSVIVWDIHEEGLQKLKEDFVQFADKIIPVKVDLSDAKEIREAGQKTLELSGAPDILINNAGIVVGKYFHEHEVSDIEKSMRINSDAPMLIAHFFLSAMIEKDNAALCNIASSAGLVANPKMSVYVASKWSVVGWSESLRLEMKQLGKKLQVTTIMPYYINTGMFAGVKSRIIRIMEPEEAAEKFIRAIEKGKKMYALPMPYWFIRLVQGILPLSAYDWVMGRIFGIYDGMEEFRGRE